MEDVIKKWKDKLNKLQLSAVLCTQQEKDVPESLMEKIYMVYEILDDLESAQDRINREWQERNLPLKY